MLIPMDFTSKKVKFIIWLLILIYPISFGFLILSNNIQRPPWLSGQAIILYGLIVAIIRSICIVNSDPKSRSAAPFSYIRSILISVPHVLFFVVAGVIVGFGARWATAFA